MKNEEQGYILIATVVAMAVLAIISTSLLGQEDFQQQLSSQLSQKRIALQFADNALEYAEQWVVNNPLPSTGGCTSVSSTPAVCVATDFNPETLLTQTNSSSAMGTVYQPSYVHTSGAFSTYQYPRFFIQYVGLVSNNGTITGTLYKITAAAYGNNASTQSVVQAMYQVTTPQNTPPFHGFHGLHGFHGFHGFSPPTTTASNSGRQISWIEWR